MPAKVEEIKDALMQDPSFEPQEGRTKEESAWAVAWNRYKTMKKNEEVLSMSGSLAKQEEEDSVNPYIHPPWEDDDIEDSIGQYQDLLGIKSPEEAFDNVKNDNPNLEDDGQKCWFWVGVKSKGLPLPSGDMHEKMEKILLGLMQILHKDNDESENKAAFTPTLQDSELDHNLLDKATKGFQKILKQFGETNQTKRQKIIRETIRAKERALKRAGFPKMPKIKKQDPWQGEISPKKSGYGNAKLPDYTKKNVPGYLGKEENIEKHRTSKPHLYGKPDQAGSNWKPYLKVKKPSEYTGLMVRKDNFDTFKPKTRSPATEGKAAQGWVAGQPGRRPVPPPISKKEYGVEMVRKDIEIEKHKGGRVHIHTYGGGVKAPYSGKPSPKINTETIKKADSPAMDLFAGFLQKEYGVEIEKQRILVKPGDTFYNPHGSATRLPLPFNKPIFTTKPKSIKKDEIEKGQPKTFYGGRKIPKSFWAPRNKASPKQLETMKITKPLSIPPIKKGGAGSGRHASRKTMRTRAKFKVQTNAVKAAIAGYTKTRKPSDYQKIVSAFRVKDAAKAKVKPWWYGLRHPLG